MIEPFAQCFNNYRRCLEIHIRNAGSEQIPCVVSEYHRVNF